ncbi:hypothetical protein H6P81_017393 [Aristolochia fimbriata]|uniref:Uncharacterized protein n=1 Tax=Aristolochia fimbriata TaxID=158543 RepID=A0AAV7DZ45_ARIFI|nr:hypothetical protein H6P81_017393 [Aristolochia fimbriata]
MKVVALALLFLVVSPAWASRRMVFVEKREQSALHENIGEAGAEKTHVERYSDSVVNNHHNIPRQYWNSSPGQHAVGGGDSDGGEGGRVSARKIGLVQGQGERSEYRVGQTYKYMQDLCKYHKIVNFLLYVLA